MTVYLFIDENIKEQIGVFSNSETANEARIQYMSELYCDDVTEEMLDNLAIYPIEAEI